MPEDNIAPLSAADEYERLVRLEQMGIPMKCWNCDATDTVLCDECNALDETRDE